MKLKSLILSAVVMFSVSIFAQEDASAMSAKSATTRENKMDDAAKLLQMRITRVLQLDAATSAKLYTPALEFFKERSSAPTQVESATALSASRKLNDADLARMIEKRETAFKEILGAERYNALQKHIAEAKAKVISGEAFSQNPDAILLLDK
ncbi:MAG TPA: hypothetical protein PL084_08635 [Chitinophagales bacterium]|nr:hypothetical protein [Chitinophagales bacterium]HRP38208.1 hypothetical protein [Chitinophagales bacterium]